MPGGDVYQNNDKNVVNQEIAKCASLLKPAPVVLLEGAHLSTSSALIQAGVVPKSIRVPNPFIHHMQTRSRLKAKCPDIQLYNMSALKLLQEEIADERICLFHADFCSTLKGAKTHARDLIPETTLLSLFRPDNPDVLAALGLPTAKRVGDVFADVAFLVVTVSARQPQGGSTVKDVADLIFRNGPMFEIYPCSITGDGNHTFHGMQTIGFGLIRKDKKVAQGPAAAALRRFCAARPLKKVEIVQAPPRARIPVAPVPVAPVAPVPVRATQRPAARAPPPAEPPSPQTLRNCYLEKVDQGHVTQRAFVSRYRVNQGNFSGYVNGKNEQPAPFKALLQWHQDGCPEVL